ncbi:DMT family transporter [Paenibacillus sp. GYB003]|uniref:DMT family transporter n=1 Tax=Paenibacillus sp. GYB003 TaxID=2994392 RepID=UPI002F9671B6
MKKEWGLLMVAGAFEVVWVSGLKHATAWWEWLITAALLLASIKVLIDSAAKLPVGTVYAVFTGLGTAGTAIAEIAVFGEPVDALKLLFIASLAAGVIGLKLLSGENKAKEGEA